jgi:TnpA family transposase
MKRSRAHSDVVCGLFRLLGYRFRPRLADVGSTRCWRLDARQADYGLLNPISAHHLSLQKITPHWDDMLRMAGSLKLGRASAAGILRTLRVGERPTGLAAGHRRVRTYRQDVAHSDLYRRRSEPWGTLTQLNRDERHHGVARAVFHGKRGELRQHYREG